MTRPLVLLFLFATSMAGCGGDKTVSDDQIVSDTDTDTDSDTDTDTGTTELGPCLENTFEVMVAIGQGATPLLASSGGELYDTVRPANRVHYEVDTDDAYGQSGGPDGVVDWSVDYLYDGSGYLSQENLDLGADGSVDVVSNYTFEADGRLLYHDRDDDVDGTPEYSIEYTYDANDLLVTVVEALNGPASPSTWYTYSRDSGDRVIRIDGDRRNDGSIEFVETVVYDNASGLTGTTTTDANNDGTPDAIAYRIYGADDQLVQLDEDQDADGDLEVSLNYTWDPVTFAPLVQEGVVDTGGPQDTFISLVWAYNDDAQRLSFVEEHHIGPQPGDPIDFSQVETYEYICPEPTP